jgi:hypothetical protein
MSVQKIEEPVATTLRHQDGVELLDTIDKLRSLGIDKDVPLPQLVVAVSEAILNTCSKLTAVGTTKQW